MSFYSVLFWVVSPMTAAAETSTSAIERGRCGRWRRRQPYEVQPAAARTDTEPPMHASHEQVPSGWIESPMDYHTGSWRKRFIDDEQPRL